MHDDADFLRAILADPFDDAPRLIYAEWLEDRAHESGGGERCDECRFYGRGASCPTCLGSGRIPDPRAARAEFIRVQCRIDQLTQGSDEEIRLQSHLTEMMLTHGDCCYGEIPPDRWAWSASYIDRGFVSSISCTIAALQQHAAEIFSKHPVTEVRLTDREPAHGYRRGPLSNVYNPLHDGRPFWNCLRSSCSVSSPQHWLPIEFAPMYKGVCHRGEYTNDRAYYFDSIDDARISLSRAAVDYGRSLAGLPPLTWPAVRENELSGISG